MVYSCIYKNDMRPSASVVLKLLVGSSAPGIRDTVLQSMINMKSAVTNEKCRDENRPSVWTVVCLNMLINDMSMYRATLSVGL